MLCERKKDEVDENEQIYSTNEGDVLISSPGTGVFIGEGFDLALARKLRDSIVSVQPGSGPMQAGECTSARACALDGSSALLRLASVNAERAGTIYF